MESLGAQVHTPGRKSSLAQLLNEDEMEMLSHHHALAPNPPPDCSPASCIRSIACIAALQDALAMSFVARLLLYVLCFLSTVGLAEPRMYAVSPIRDEFLRAMCTPWVVWHGMPAVSCCKCTRWAAVPLPKPPVTARSAKCMHDAR